MRSGELSRFLGSTHPDFYGGKKIQEFEEKWAGYFEINHALSVNSATSGLIAALGAIGIEPGDEVITSPWTMSATAMAILHWNAIPIFADIDPETFCISPTSIASKITPKTKAILAVDIFGQSCEMFEIMNLAKRHKLKVVSDTSQAPGALYQNKFAGTIADIGVFSLNYHKHIHTGEGGMVVTNNSELAERIRLIRNHGESVIETDDSKNLINIVGHNFRMGEIEAAIGIEQLKKLKSIVNQRQENASEFNQILTNLPGIVTPKVLQENTHSYYVYPLKIVNDKMRANKFILAEELKKNGILGISTKYQNLHLLPIFQHKIAYGSAGFPWTLETVKTDYSKGLCPIAEELQDTSYLGFYMGGYALNGKSSRKIANSMATVFAKFVQ
jgi:dTDP-4-amino-4,6-dideoxygalactose transaminase